MSEAEKPISQRKLIPPISINQLAPSLFNCVSPQIRDYIHFKKRPITETTSAFINPFEEMAASLRSMMNLFQQELTYDLKNRKLETLNFEEMNIKCKTIWNTIHSFLFYCQLTKFPRSTPGYVTDFSKHRLKIKYYKEEEKPAVEFWIHFPPGSGGRWIGTAMILPKS